MTLSKLEIQQMLREMNVKFNVDDSYQTLKHRLQEENHNQWLKSVSKCRASAGTTNKVVVRKRKKEAQAPDASSDIQDLSARLDSFEEAARRRKADYPRNAEPVYRPHPIEKPGPGKPWKTVADGTEPFNRKKNVFASVLQRAAMGCECCGIKVEPGDSTGALKPYHLQPISRGGEHSTKNVVALCPACLERVQTAPSSKAIKDLKRKTRSRLYDSLEVIRKNTGYARRPFPSRSKDED